MSARLRAAGGVLLCVLVVLTLVAPARSLADEPWIFLVHDGEGENNFFRGMMTDIRRFRSGPGGEPEFFAWIARTQQDFDEDECSGLPLTVQTMVQSQVFLEQSFRWYLESGFSDAEFGRRPAGARVEEAFLDLDGFEVKPGTANYITCAGNEATFLRTTNIGRHSANRITVGPGANPLTDHVETFRLSAAHELSHVVQNNTAPFAVASPATRRSVKPGLGWIIEGAADAVAIMHVHDSYGRDYFGPYSNKFYRRFFLSRAYNVPLNLQPGANRQIHLLDSLSDEQTALLMQIEQKTLKLLHYQSNGFWFHVIERYLDGDPLGLVRLYRRMGASAVSSNATRIVDRFLDRIDGPSLDGLAHVYPQFLTEYASWWDHRFDNAMSERKWLDLGFNGCEGVELGGLRRSFRFSLRIAEYAGACFVVRLGRNEVLVQPDLEIRVAGDDRAVNEVYLGRASASGLADENRDADCYEIVENKLSPVPAPCLLDPMQGRSGNELQRYFNIPRLRGPGEEVEMTFILTWVPKDVADVGHDFEQADLEVTVALDLAELSEDGGASGRSSAGRGSDGPADDDAEKAAVTEYASKQGRGRVSPESDKSPGEVGPREIFSGDFASMPGVSANARDVVRSAMDTALTVRLEPKEGQALNEATAVTFQFLERPRPGHTGPVEVQAMSSRDDLLGIQDPGRPSTLTIEEYSDEVLVFRGIAHVCEGRPEDLAARPGAQLCEVFTPRSYRVSGSVAFPTVRNSEARLQPAESEPYLAYRDLRLDAILGPETDTDDSLQQTGDPGAPAAGAAGSGPGGSAVDASRQDCDCSCEARLAEPSLRCKLLCGKQWQQCPAE